MKRALGLANENVCGTKADASPSWDTARRAKSFIRAAIIVNLGMEEEQGGKAAAAAPDVVASLKLLSCDGLEHAGDLSQHRQELELEKMVWAGKPAHFLTDKKS